MKYYLLNTVQFGRALFAIRDIEEGEIICTCEVLVLNQIDTKKVNDTELKWYTFTYDLEKGIDCLVLGDGEIFNHDDNANVSYELINLNGRSQMQFRAIKPIKKDSQLFIDYNADVKDKKDVLSSYTTNMM